MDISSIRLYTTGAHPCSYLEGQAASTAFVDPNLAMDSHVYSTLSTYGFRRSGKHVYKPVCMECQACIPVRIPVEMFQAKRSQKRCLKHNKDLSLSVIESIDTDEHYQLFERYISIRHSDGDMHPTTRKQYIEFLGSAWGVTRYLEMRLRGELIGVAVTDQLHDGLSAIYTFFEPEYSGRSLGVYGILQQIHWASDLQLPFLYLGYWIKDCAKMNYKSQYRPLQVLLNKQWISLK